MEVWQMALYGTAGVLSLRTLAGLMTAHKQRLLDEHDAKLERIRRDEEARKQAEREAALQAAKKRAAEGGLRWPKSDNAAA